MDSQAEDVIIVAHVESLGILLSVVHNANGSHVVDDLSGLSVEQVAPAIVAPVAATKHDSGLLYGRLSGGAGGGGVGVGPGKDIGYDFNVLSCCPTHEWSGASSRSPVLSHSSSWPLHGAFPCTAL